MKKSNSPLVSIVMLAFNRKDEVLDSLEHLSKCNYDNYEIILIDNASADGTSEEVRKKFPSVKLTVLDENIGITGYNNGFEQAQGEYVIVVDDDSYIEKDAIKKTVEKFRELPEDVGILNYQVIYTVDGHSTTLGWPDYVMNFWGCGAAIKKELINKIGGYDPKLFLYRNELEMGIRTLVNGYKVYHCQDILAYHKAPINRYLNKRTFLYVNMNDIYLLYKYFPVSKSINHLSFIFIKTFVKSFNYDGFPFFSIWRGAFKKIKGTKRTVIKDKNLIKFIYNDHNKIPLPNLLSDVLKRPLKKNEVLQVS